MIKFPKNNHLFKSAGFAIFSFSLVLVANSYATTEYTSSSAFDEFKSLKQAYVHSAGEDTNTITQDITNRLENIVKNMKELPNISTNNALSSLQQIQEDVRNISNTLPTENKPEEVQQKSSNSNNTDDDNDNDNDQNTVENIRSENNSNLYTYKNGNIRTPQKTWTYNDN